MSLSVAPPLYEPNAHPLRAPSYAVLPRSGEQRLALSGRVPARALRSGTFEKRTRRLVLALYDQREGAELPVLDRGGHASGCVGLLERAQEVQKVELKIEGEMHALPERRQDKYKVQFLAETVVLWERGASDSAVCPSEIPFRVRIPKTFADPAGERWPLPPTFEFKMKTMYGFIAAAQCTLSVCLTLAKGADNFWSRDRTLSTAFVLQARSRPPYETIDMSARLMDTLKTCPEAWALHNLTIQTTSSIAGQLYLPRPTAYCMNDPIPFHLQLSGSASALEHFHSSRPAAERGTVTVSLLRHVSLTTASWGDIVHSFTSGSGTLTLVHESAELLAWEGALTADVALGSFRVGPVAFADFVAVAVEPPRTKKTQKAAFVQALRRVAIALTTDRWQDTGEAGPAYST